MVKDVEAFKCFAMTPEGPLLEYVHFRRFNHVNKGVSIHYQSGCLREPSISGPVGSGRFAIEDQSVIPMCAVRLANPSFTRVTP
jgi:hypothetical protein